MASSKLTLAASVALWIVVTACAGGSASPTVASLAAGPTTTAARTEGTSDATTPLAKAQAYAKCMRNHAVPNFPDPVETPGGGYGFRTEGIDPKASAFQSASRTCDALVPGGWGGMGKPLTPAQQQQWLNWATCIRTHGVPGFPDPTFSGTEVHITQGDTSSPQMRTAMDACKARLPSTGGLGG